MICPGCTSTEMDALSLDALYGGKVQIDLCHACHSIWFDHLESLQLAPNATLQLFRIIHEKHAEQPRPLLPKMGCPRCGTELLLTRDMQRGVWFTYYRCPNNHGRQTPFFQFLKEKNLVKPLSPDQLAQLKAQVKVIRCSNCGAPVDLERHTVCAHCQSAISGLDPTQVEKTLDQLREYDRKRQNVDPNIAAQLVMDKLKAEGFYKRLAVSDPRTRIRYRAGIDLLDVGIDALFGFFS